MADNFGLELNERFFIRLQQKDNYRARTDGFAFDNLSVVPWYQVSGESRDDKLAMVVNHAEECASLLSDTNASK